MAEQTDKAPSRKIELYQRDGDASVLIEAEIDEAGDLVLSGVDSGEAPLEFWGDSDYEYWLTVRAQHKDQLLLALVERLYSGNPSAVSEFRDLLEALGLPFEWFSWV